MPFRCIKKPWSFSIIPRQFLIGLMLQDDETAKGKGCVEQWTYSAFGYLFLIIIWIPLNWPAMLLALSSLVHTYSHNLFCSHLILLNQLIQIITIAI